MIEHLSQALILIVVVGIAAQWISWRFKAPAIVVLSVAGVLIGPVLGWVQPELMLGRGFQPLIELSVAIILFEGGLSLRFYEFKEAGGGVKRLITLGLLLNWIFGSLFAHYVGQFSWPIAFFLGSLLVVTGPTVIMPALRQARLHRRPAAYLKWEGIINDPLGALLAIVTYEYLIYSGNSSPLIGSIFGILKALVCALFLTASFGSLLTYGFRKAFIPDFLKVPIVLSSVLAVYAIGNWVQDGGGLLSTTFLGIYFGNVRLAILDDLRRFKESLSIFILSVVFVLLAASLRIEHILYLTGPSLFFILGLMFVVRPAAVFLSTMRSEMTWRERLIVAWFAPRGIVLASVAGTLAPRLMEQGYPDAEIILPLVFAVIFITVSLHGFSLSFLARLLKLSTVKRNGVLLVGASPWTTQLARALHSESITVMLSDVSPQKLRRARRAGVPIHMGPILTDIEEGIPDLSDYRYLLVATENDAYNALVCTKIGSEVGKKNSFQLPLTTDEDSDESLPLSLQGTLIKDKRFQFENLTEAYFQGWSFQTLRIEEDGTLDSKIQEGDIPFILIKNSGELRFLVNTLEPTKLVSGDKVILFGKAKT